VVAGSGADMGNYFLGRLYSPTLTISEATMLMGFICREAQDSSSGVGLGTEILALTASGPSRTMAGDADVPRLTDVMTRFWETKSTTKIAGRGLPRKAGKT